MVELFSLLAFFSLGILSGGHPCALPLLPGFIGYLSSRSGQLQDREKSLVGLLIVLGVTTGMIGFAVGATLARASLGRLLTAATPVIIVLLILFGAMLILGHNPFYRLPYVKVPQVRSHLLEAYAYGGLYGVIALPCSAPVIFPVILGLTIPGADTLGTFILFLVFGLGLGLPVIVVSLLSQAQGNWLVRQFAKRTRTMNILAGVLLIGVAIYDLIIVYPFLQIYLPS